MMRSGRKRERERQRKRGEREGRVSQRRENIMNFDNVAEHGVKAAGTETE